MTVDYQLLTQEAGARFGAALAVGDFNSNGVDDLVIGLPGHTVNGQAGGAAVVLLDYRGTSWYAPRYYHQNITFFHDATEDGDDFGSTFAVGDFNADGYDDLAIGVPGEDLAGLADAGAVHVLYGGPGGLQTSSEVFLDRSIAPGSLEANARFGASLATGDFNLDGFDDLAIGAPLETVQGAARAGTVTIAYGSGAGLPLSGGQWWSQWQLGAVNELDTAEANDEFGRALAVGDFNHDGFDDLAVGVPRETADLSFTGALNVIYGSGSGLSAAGNLFTPQVVSRQQQSQRFGSALAAADFDGDGIDDLAVGVPYADV
ncbi:MAG: FG-GAP repeat protein, partial [Planctomycetales bacterium]|nr:FG-GAP repeat protein [Planctomycetales bacterium]